jgi:peptidylprolyl isomerase
MIERRFAYLASSCLLTVACSAASTLPVAGTRDAGSKSSPSTPEPDAGAAAVEEPGLDPAQFPLPEGFRGVAFLSEAPVRKFAAPEAVLSAGYQYLWVLETDAGRLEADLYDEQAPQTANSFVFLTLHHFYDGLALHRVVEGFVAQGGDPLTLGANTARWGSGGPGYAYGLEVTPALKYDAAGVLGAARSESKDSNGSQFFLMLAGAPSLNQQYSIFGKLRSGLDVLPKIARGEPPALPTRITRAYIGKKKR